jgi:hypothetical protein
MSQGYCIIKLKQLDYLLTTYLLSHTNIRGDLKWLWKNMATMYENVCGNSVGRIELTFLFFDSL